MYSEHGFDARMRPPAGLVCQSFMVVLKWRPGSAEAQAAWPICSHRSRAFRVFIHLAVLAGREMPVGILLDRAQESSVSETELLEFWPETVR